MVTGSMEVMERETVVAVCAKVFGADHPQTRKARSYAEINPRDGGWSARAHVDEYHDGGRCDCADSMDQTVIDNVDCPHCGQARGNPCGRLYRTGTFRLTMHPHKQRVALYKTEKDA